jgi:hypothetical protein
MMPDGILDNQGEGDQIGEVEADKLPTLGIESRGISHLEFTASPALIWLDFMTQYLG